MQCILREKLVAHSIKLAEVSNLYIKDSTAFVSAYLNWLIEAEKDLAGLRSPISVLLQAEKSTVIAVIDGLIPDHIQAGNSIRKMQRAAAAQSLERISKQIYTKIEAIDANFEQLNEKLCHAVAVVISKIPELMAGIQTGEIGSDRIWKILGDTPETLPMYNYFSSKLSTTDRMYLLDAIIQNIRSG